MDMWDLLFFDKICSIIISGVYERLLFFNKLVEVFMKFF